MESGWHEEQDLEERIRLAYGDRGFPKGTPLRGAKRCGRCGIMWDRDLNAAINILIGFWFVRMNQGRRPFPYQRKKDN